MVFLNSFKTMTRQCITPTDVYNTLYYYRAYTHTDTKSSHTFDIVTSHISYGTKLHVQAFRQSIHTQSLTLHSQDLRGTSVVVEVHRKGVVGEWALHICRIDYARHWLFGQFLLQMPLELPNVIMLICIMANL